MEITLLPPHERYAEVFYQWRNEPYTLKFNPVVKRTLEEVRASLLEGPFVLAPLSENTNYRWFVECDGEVVGTVSLSCVNAMMKFGEIGYMISEAHHGLGIATQAVKLWTSLIFGNTDLRKLTASAAKKNIASLRVLEKVGYAQEGVLSEHFIVNGMPVDQVVFGMLRSNWHV